MDQLNLMLRFGLKTNATIQQIAQTVGFALLTGLLEILMTMCTAYLAITLSATLLQNKKGFVRGLISLVLFCALSWGAGWLTQRLLNGSVSFDSVESITSGQLTRAFGLSALLNFGFCAVFTVVSAWLLDHKIDL